MNKVSSIKERIKEIAVNSGFSQEDFFKKIGSTSANFRGKKLSTGVNSELIEKIITLFPDTDLHWLITGEEKKWQIIEEEKEDYGKIDKRAYIELLEENRMLHNENRSLRKKIDSIKKEGCKTSCKS